MSDAQETPLLRVADSESPPSAVSAAVQAGALLRSYRERARLDLEALAAVVKVPVRRLEALEAGRLDALPEPVYVRAMVLGMCRVLQADPQPVLALLPITALQPLRQDGGIEPVPFRSPASGTPQAFGEMAVKPPLRWALALVVGAALLYGWPSLEGWWVQNRPDQEAFAVVKPWTASGSVSETAESTAVAPLLVPAVPAAAPVPVPAPALPAVAAAPADESIPAPPPAVREPEPSIPVPGTELLSLKAHGLTWVEVRDAKGVFVLRRNLVNGERVSASGQLPLSVVVGRADITEVWVRGKVFETKAISQENVARFEVK